MRKVNTGDTITTIAGTGTAGFGGDGRPATGALLSHPVKVATDGLGNVYISDFYNARIRKVNALGIISTIAGGGLSGLGDNGPATSAELSSPESTTLDATGNIYIVDQGNNRLRKINTSGIITTLAGDGTVGYSGDNCNASSAELNLPFGVALNSAGYIYIADASNSRIRMVSPGHPPAFMHGHTQALSLCENAGDTAINALLAIVDSDANQSELWSLLSAPVHGTAIVTDTATSTGGVIVPAGLSYRPAAGYSCNDTFRVLVMDCGNASDTTVIYVTVVNCKLGVNTFAGGNIEVHLYPNPATTELTITATDKITNVSVCNILGQPVYTRSCNAEQIELNIANLPAGIYFVKVNGSEVSKFVKE